ncbi:hypothetical protein BpHYR1_049683 [Brachionus plicatilis]|uniref:Uncharacterized protein n=1 Tax=Brachionus plicatilis TaxID=10195 RepID=A0A3M7SC61_BRAPC|nr:hypothetical protein BpHYR1_049683 [Brachionus plicatilis]
MDLSQKSYKNFAYIYLIICQILSILGINFVFVKERKNRWCQNSMPEWKFPINQFSLKERSKVKNTFMNKKVPKLNQSLLEGTFHKTNCYISHKKSICFDLF